MLTADDEAIIWVNQNRITRPPNNKIWNRAQSYVFPSGVRVIAVAIINSGGGNGGLLASFDNGVYTDSSWRCAETVPPAQWTESKFDDTLIPQAVIYGGHNIQAISPKAKWIGPKNRKAPKMYCRRSFKTGSFLEKFSV